MTLIPAYRSRPSALHSARAGVGAAFCCAFALVGALYRNPLILARRARRDPRGRQRGRGRAARSAARCGWRCRSRCWSRWSTRSSTRRATRCWCAAATFLGRRWDITLEATVEGLMNGMRIVVLIAALGGLMSAAVDPDELLKALRRVSYRSALTAVAGHAARAGARPRRRPHGRRRPLPARSRRAAWRWRGRRWPARSTAPSTWPRRSRCAATRSRGGPARRSGRVSRHDLRIGAAALAIAAAAIAGAVAGVGARRGLPDAGRWRVGPARARARDARWWCSGGAPLLGPRRAAGGGAVPEPLVLAERFSYAYPEARPALAARHLARARARHLHGARRRVGLGQVDAAARALRARAALPRRRGERAAGGRRPDVREHGPGELAAVCGTVFQEPETQVVMGGVRAELALPLEHRGEPPAAVARAVEETALVARHRPPARAPHRHALGRRAAARGDRRRDGPPARAAAARRADLAARPGRRRRAGLAAAAAERGVGHGRGGRRAPARALPARGRPRDRAGRGPDRLRRAAARVPRLGAPRRCRCSPRRSRGCSRSPGCPSAPASVKEARAGLRDARDRACARRRSAAASNGCCSACCAATTAPSRRCALRGVWFEIEDGPSVLRGLDLRAAPGRAGRADGPQRRRQEHAAAAGQGAGRAHPRARSSAPARSRCCCRTRATT